MEQRLAMNKPSVSPDIELFVHRKLAQFMDENIIPRQRDVDSLVQRLVYGAVGMFLWARLMIIYLSSHALTDLERLYAIQDADLPEGLDSIYIKILELITVRP